MPPPPASSEAAAGTHSPVTHVWFAGQWAPVHALTHVPDWQTSPAGQLTVAQSVATQWPVSAPVVSHVCADVHAVQGHDGTHVPISQTWPWPQFRFAQGSTQFPRRQTCPIGHTIPLHASTHEPFTQRSPEGHVTLRQSVWIQ